MDHPMGVGALAITRDLQIPTNSMTIILARVIEVTMGYHMTMADGLQSLMQMQRYSTTTDIIIRAMREVMVCPIVAKKDTARGLQSLIQNLIPSITTVITRVAISRAVKEAMSCPIEATMDMARGLLNLKPMSTLGHSIITAFIDITLQATDMGLAMAGGPEIKGFLKMWAALSLKVS